jgi:glutathione S-transferase
MENQTPEQIAQHYKAMGDSVWLINAVIAGETMSEESDAEKKAAVERNVAHLEAMLKQDYWTTEDMTAVNAAVAAGKAYV